MFSDLDAMELLCRGHALEWTGHCWMVASEPEEATIVSCPDERVAHTACLIGAPTVAFETFIICAGSRMAALLHDTGADRAWC